MNEEQEFRLDDGDNTPRINLPQPVPHQGPGQPTKYNEDIANLIVMEIITTTDSMRDICARCGISYRTNQLWLLKYPEYFALYARAKSLQIEVMVDDLRDISRSDVGENMAAAQMRRLEVDTIKWLASKLAPKIYGNNGATEVNVNINDNTSKDEFKAILEMAKKQVKEQRSMQINPNIEDATILE
jgi:hypothetical protein